MIDEEIVKAESTQNIFNQKQQKEKERLYEKSYDHNNLAVEDYSEIQDYTQYPAIPT